MNILVADDEVYARKSLIQMIKEWNAEAGIYEAENGLVSLEIIADNRIDLVLTDIRMPGLNGLQLAKEIHERYSACTVVIFSGYDDFKYAQKAIQYKVEYFLLKPLEEEELVSILQDRYSKWQYALRQEAVIALSNHCLEVGNVATDYLSLLGLKSYNVAVMQLEHSVTEIDLEILNHGLAKVCGFTLLYRDSKFNRAVIVLQEETASKKHCLQQFIEEYIQKTGERISIGLSRNYRTQDEFVQAYREAKKALMLRYFQGCNRIIEYKKSEKKRYKLDLFDELMMPFYNRMINNQVEEAQDIIQRLLRIIVELNFSLYTLRDTCSKIAAVINSVTEHVNNNSSEPISFMDQPDLDNYQELKDIIECFASQISYIAKNLSENSAKTDIIEQLRNYVERNYRQDIRLEELAESYYTDVSYLSRQFKKKCGVGFSKFLTIVRLDNARKMLKTNPDLTVSEVAGSVGFNDYSYFIQLYRKFYGETPGQSKKSVVDKSV
ncbi:response regulator [Paenibacillus doosanensis]|uniref:response regulator n=1 Tax=Paenibacillus doosanensis TaxID=1229154 RepID=UPI00217F7581|nr:response regulator [Paenibacillus doosanensis]MCS7461445.1 response regulator [Paenibacillus doosanensis]